MMKTETFKIEELAKEWTPEASWSVPTAHDKGTFLFPAFGPNNYNDAVRQVTASKLRLPTGEQNAFMLDEAYNSADEQVKNSPRTKFIRDIVMGNGWLWVPNVNIWTPKSGRNPGMYSVFDENGEGLSRVYTPEELEDRLSGSSTERRVRFSKDRKVAFAPLNTIKTRTRGHDRGTLAQEGEFIATYGVEGAEKLDNVAKVFIFKPYSYIIDNNSDKPIQSLSALCRGWYGGYDRLSAGFDADDYDRGGYVLPVSGSGISAEGTAPKK